jgi:spore maturation protein CgeB
MHSQGFTVFHDMALDPFLYDSLALTDYKPEIKVWLRNYYKDVTYTNINDLFTKLDYYLTNDKIRNDLVQLIKECLLNNVYNKGLLIELIEDIYSKLTNKQKNI